MQLLQRVLLRCSSLLDAKTATVVIEKLIDKIKDIYCCTYCVKILHDCFLTTNNGQSLRQDLFTADLVEKILKGVSAPNLTLQSYNQRTRIAVLKIYEAFTLQPNLLLNQVRQPYFFVSYVLQAIDGEKDPRNLLYTFDLVFEILTLYFQEGSKPLQDVAVDSQTLDDLFDAVARYFPINFTPPKSDTNKITPELLHDLLRKCMLASPRTAHLFLSFLLEKLPAKAIKTKI
jgi:hypothetical protein